jgi:hypothetical protein
LMERLQDQVLVHMKMERGIAETGLMVRRKVTEKFNMAVAMSKKPITRVNGVKA